MQSAAQRALSREVGVRLRPWNFVDVVYEVGLRRDAFVVYLVDPKGGDVLLGNE